MKSNEGSSEKRHTLKNFLMGIKAFTDLIRMETRDYKSKDVKEYLEKIDKKIDEATDYINKEI